MIELIKSDGVYEMTTRQDGVRTILIKRGKYTGCHLYHKTNRWTSNFNIWIDVNTLKTMIDNGSILSLKLIEENQTPQIKTSREKQLGLFDK